MPGRPPRRSVLCMPCGDERKVVKAMTAGADQVVIDPEEAVAPAHRARARPLLDTVAWGEFDCRPAIAVRVNAPRSRWRHLDSRPWWGRRSPRAPLCAEGRARR
ncbi:aldolase/citrate lyase family protein [Nocardia gamkensis]|uniref:aldolase/citrate lyase family protein n=1 Tax=Nocardia gamkensis TaxID=352869 RepID=UPI0037CC1FFC